MKLTAALRLLPVVGAAVVLPVVGPACSGRVGGAPRNISLAAASDSTVILTWDRPGPGSPDDYIVYFRPVGAEAWLKAGEPDATEFEHDPGGMTGWYRVAARFGPDLHFPAETVSTVPITTFETVLAELHASGNSGFGWDRASGIGRSYPMTVAASAAYVDLFVTDFDTGYGGPVYALASPTYGPSDPSGMVPAARWRLTRFSPGLPEETAVLPRDTGQTYLTFRAVAPGYEVGCRTEDGYFALVRVIGINLLTGELRLHSRFQTVPGLRLVRPMP